MNLSNKSSIFVYKSRFIINCFISYAYWPIVYFNNELISYPYFYLSFTLCIVVREDLQVITSPFVTNNIDLFYLIFFRFSTCLLFLTPEFNLLIICNMYYKIIGFYVLFL